MPDYTELLESTKVKYEGRILSILHRIRLAFLERGYTSAPGDEEPVDMTGDEYAWSLVVLPPGKKKDKKTGYPDDAIDVRFEINEECANTGDGEGINFSIDFSTLDNRIIGGIRPFNYTEKCWVDPRDSVAVEARFSLVEKFDHGHAVAELDLS